MRILLVDPPWYSLQGIRSTTVSMGLASLAGSLERNGHSVFLWNGDLYGARASAREGCLEHIDADADTMHTHPAFDDLRARIQDLAPELVGISSMTSDFFAACFAVRLVKKFRRDLPCVIGGVHATLCPDEAMRQGDFDYLVQGEGEDTMVELARCLSPGSRGQLSAIQGLWYREGNSLIRNPPRPLCENLDSLPLPSYRGLIDLKMHRPVDVAGVITSRGCPFPCTYCASKQLWTQRVRCRSIGYVLEEIRRLYDCGVRVVRLNDDAFTLNRGRVLEFCSGVRTLRGLRWSCDTRPELLDSDLMRRMRACGCYQVNIGIETASLKIQKETKKLIDLKRALVMIRRAQREGIRVTAYFMVGFPSETAGDMEATAMFIRTSGADNPIVSTVTPYPGTELWGQVSRSHQLSPSMDFSLFYHHSDAMNFSQVSTDEFRRMLLRFDRLCTRVSRRRKSVFVFTHPLFAIDYQRRIRPQFLQTFDELGIGERPLS